MKTSITRPYCFSRILEILNNHDLSLSRRSEYLDKYCRKQRRASVCHRGAEGIQSSSSCISNTWITLDDFMNQTWFCKVQMFESRHAPCGRDSTAASSGGTKEAVGDDVRHRKHLNCNSCFQPVEGVLVHINNTTCTSQILFTKLY